MSPIRRGLNKVKNLLSKEQTHILETAFILMLPVILSKIFGQIFQLLLASTYGLDDSRLNQFFIANAIPELLTTVLMVGAVGTVTIPILISVKKKEDEEHFYRIYSSIINVTLLLFSIIGAFLILFADKLIPLAISLTGTEIPPSDIELNNIVWMMRAMVIPQFILGVSVFISTGLNVYDRYLLPQLSPLFFNLGRTIAFVLLFGLLDKSPWAIVAGTYVGAILHLVIQIPLFLHLKIKYYFYINLQDKNIREMFKLGIPRIAVLASDHIGLLINNFISLAFIAGPAALNFAKSLYLLIPSLFGYTFSYASYPTLARMFSEGENEKIRKITCKTLQEIFFMSLPFIITLLVLRVPIVRLTYGILPNTSFSLQDTYQVAWLMLFFSFGLAFITARWFLFSLFYASKDTITPSLVSIGSLISVVAFSVLFTNLLSHTPDFDFTKIQWSIENLFNRSPNPNRVGVGGIAMSMSFVYTIEFFVMLYLFNRNKIKLGLKSFFIKLFDKLLASSVMLCVMYIIYKVWDKVSYAFPDTADYTYSGSTTVNLFILTVVTVVPGFMVYYLISYLLRVEELKILRRYLNPIFKIGGLKINK
ncbi:MAG: hypothetical protein Kow0081_3010 [Candidatus Dojkabacteria bacterium]